MRRGEGVSEPEVWVIEADGWHIEGDGVLVFFGVHGNPGERAAFGRDVWTVVETFDGGD